MEAIAPEDKREMPAPREAVDAYFSADVETDGPIPGPFSMLSVGIAFAGRYDGKVFKDLPISKTASTVNSSRYRTIFRMKHSA